MIECPDHFLSFLLRELLAVLSRIRTQGHGYESLFRQSSDRFLGTDFSARAGCNALRGGDGRPSSDPRGRAGSGAHGSADYLRFRLRRLLQFGVLSLRLD